MGRPSLGEDGGIEYPDNAQSGMHLRSVDFTAILKRIKSENARGWWSDAPHRVLLNDPGRPGVVNLAQMTAAESNWTEVLGTVAHQLERVIEGLSRLQMEPLGPTTSQSLDYKNGIAKAHADLDARALGISATAKDDSSLDQRVAAQQRRDQALAAAVAHWIGVFQFAPHTLRQFIQLNPTMLLPLYSFGLLATLDQVANFSSDSWQFMGSDTVERALIFVLWDYLGQKFQMDSVTLTFLVAISRLDLLHPLLRLTAFAIIESHLGFDPALERAGLSVETWETLYAQSAKRVMLSPTALGVHLVAHFDYFKNLKLNVDPFVRAVQRSARVNLGLPPLDLRERREVEDDTLPSTNDLPSERLLRRIRVMRTGEKG
ncbi:MAG: hypothetical protein HY921_13195 [Elusimicrobia bacterium]|nr:hypothetical protein [Elusimicrobiota bacterium]